ncbi:hypothetical protein Tco_1449508 [Tanacetum coccineum]
MNELNKLQDQAYENCLIYKEKTKKIHDSKIKNREFHVSDCVLLFNSRLKIFSGKLKSRWSSPFTIAEVFPYGTVELSQPNGPNFKVNGHWIKHYIGGDNPAIDVPDLHFSDTGPPMLDKTDFASWQQHIRLYCWGKENEKQHEAHANENKMMLERFTQPNVDPLALMSNVSHQRVVVQNVQGRQNRGQGNNAKGTGAAGYGGAHNRVKNANPCQSRQIKCYNCNVFDFLFVDEDVDEQPVYDLALNVDNVFQADDCDAFDSDVDEAPTAQTMFMANLSSADPYVKDNAISFIQSNVSSVPNDAYTMIIKNAIEQTARVFMRNKQNKVVNASLTAELATYKEQVKLYERRAKFELTKKEQKIKEQLRIVITDCNIKEEKFKKELHFVKMQLSSTINHNKSMVEEVTSLKKDFKQKENKYLEEFLDMKALKEKALTKEIKDMKEVFEELEAEVDQNVVIRKHDEIERKNLLIANDNLIVDFLSKEVFYLATNSELTISRFTEMHDAHTIVQAHCLELEAELSKLCDKVQQDEHTELVKRFSNLEVNHLNLQLKYQNLKERFRNNTFPPARDAPDFDSVFVIEKMKASILGKDNAIKKLRMHIS